MQLDIIIQSQHLQLSAFEVEWARSSKMGKQILFYLIQFANFNEFYNRKSCILELSCQHCTAVLPPPLNKTADPAHEVHKSMYWGGSTLNISVLPYRPHSLISCV